MKHAVISVPFALCSAVGLLAVGCGDSLEEVSHTAHLDSDELLAAPVQEPEASPVVADEVPPTRRILAVEGTVTIDGNPAEVGDPLGEAIELRTSEEGGAVITLSEGGLIDIGPDTTFRIGSSPRASTSLELVLGTLWSFLPTGSDFEVVTSNAVAGVRGTIFFVNKDHDRHSYVCACHGKVAIEGTGRVGHKRLNELVFSPQLNHKAFDVRGQRVRTRARQARRRDHSEARKMELMPYMQEVGYEMTSYD